MSTFSAPSVDLGPAPDPGPRRGRRRQVIHGDPSQIAGRPWAHAITLLFLLAAAAVDVVTFHQVLLQALNESDTVLWIAVVGFTVVSIALAHWAGEQAKQAANPRYVLGARWIMWLCLGGWALLGLTAFAFRYGYTAPADVMGSTFIVDGQSQDLAGEAAVEEQHMQAWLFLALYVGTGLISGTSGFLRLDPAARQYMKALSRRTKAAKQDARTRSLLAGVEETGAAIERTRGRADTDWADAQRQCDDAAVRLKQETRLLMFDIGPGPGTSGPATTEEEDPR